jgi:hypothetical protein
VTRVLPRDVLALVCAAAGGLFADQRRWGYAIAAGLLAVAVTLLDRKDRDA